MDTEQPRSPSPGVDDRSLGAASISVCIVCRNEADKLEACLPSVAWADEVIVMDLLSEDGSADVARRFGARVVTREPHPIVEPLRNELAEIAHGEWILALDPDERVSPALAGELRRLAGEPDIDAVVIPRMNIDLGYAPTSPVHRYEGQVRMYRRSRVTWPVIPNALPQVPAERRYRISRQDDLVIIHDRSRNVQEILDRFIRYAPAQAQSMIDQGQRFTARGMLGALGSSAYKQFVVARPWRDGVPGMLRAGILVSFRFYVWTAFWQLSGARRTSADDRLVRRLGIPIRAIGLVVGLYRMIGGLVGRMTRGRLGLSP